jgi:hypothetical protein
MLQNAAIVTFDLTRAETSIGRRTLVLARRAGRWEIVHLHASNVALPR